MRWGETITLIKTPEQDPEIDADGILRRSLGRTQ